MEDNNCEMQNAECEGEDTVEAESPITSVKDSYTPEDEGSEVPPSAADTHARTLENTTSHLTSSVPRSAGVPTGAMSRSEMREMRELFSNLTDAEIQRLYKKVTK